VGGTAPTATFARGFGAGAGSCDGDCTTDEVLQIRARDGSGAGLAARQAATDSAAKANAGQADPGPKPVQTRAAAGGARAGTTNASAVGRNANRAAVSAGNGIAASNGQGTGAGLGRGPDGEWEQSPGECELCTAEMGSLTDAQVADLVFMANEEKMAHDVYAAFAEQYGLRTFERIAAAEAQHQAAVSAALERHGLEGADVASLPAGEFSDDTVAALYAGFIEQGSVDLDGALAAAVAIEQADIDDLVSRMSDLETSAPDVYQLYTHLQTASETHLKTFSGLL
jgi:hypothetical protein